jgi:hypothetical protein
LPEKMSQDSLKKLKYAASLNLISRLDGEGEFDKVYTSEMFKKIIEDIKLRIAYLKGESTGDIMDSIDIKT